MGSLHTRRLVLMTCMTMASGIASVAAAADDTIKVGLSVPLSGSGAVWGRGADWMCKKAAQEIKADGGVRVKDRVYNFECLSYDNKYSAAEGTKVAQTLLNRDGVKFMTAVGTASALAAQSLTERQGVLFFTESWDRSRKGPNFPLTFSVVNSLFEIMPVMVQYIVKTHPEAKTIALLNANDASGRENEAISRPMWEKAGVKVVASDFYERGTTEFQPIAARLVSLKPDIIDLASAPPADAGQMFKELDLLGFKGSKITDNGTGVDAILTSGGSAVNGVYMGAATAFNGPSVTAHQRDIAAQARAGFGEAPSLPSIGAYDTLYILKAGIEKAQSVDPKAVAAVLPEVKFKTFYGGETGFGGKSFYGSNQQAMLPVYVTQIDAGKLVERARVDPKKN
ncbi:branched-chain amino acid transport system substrate-binding protein [Burkholderia sp. YR290]|nr:branched-chain amino acid transport system substrate-binding protein [Burkholderia sp. YR290]